VDEWEMLLYFHTHMNDRWFSFILMQTGKDPAPWQCVWFYLLSCPALAFNFLFLHFIKLFEVAYFLLFVC